MKPPCYGIPKAADSFNESWFSLSATNESHWRLIKSSRLRLGKLPVSERERRLRQDGGGALSCKFHIYIGGEILLQLSKWKFIFNALLSYFPQEEETDEGNDRLWGINFCCIAVGLKLGWDHFSSPPNAPTLSCFSAFLVGKLPGASSFVPAADFLIGDLHPIQSSTASPFFSEYDNHTHAKSNVKWTTLI